MKSNLVSVQYAREKLGIPVNGGTQKPLTPKEHKKAVENELEEGFSVRWRNRYPDLPFDREVEFLPPRKFRADFFWEKARVVVELQGGIHLGGKGGHTSGAGISRDCEKVYLSNCAGFVVFPLTPEMARDPETLDGIAGVVRKRS